MLCWGGGPQSWVKTSRSLKSRTLHLLIFNMELVTFVPSRFEKIP